jgi:hypothetical protein
MQMGAGILSARSMEIYAAASRMRKKESDFIRTGKAYMQG